MCFYFNLEFRIYSELSSVSVGIKTCPGWMCYECVQLKYEIFSRCGSSSPDNAEFVHYSLLFCRVRRRNVPRFITHLHSYCFVYLTFCLTRLSLSLPSCFAQGPYDLYSTRLSDNRRALSNIRWVRWRKWISLARSFNSLSLTCLRVCMYSLSGTLYCYCYCQIFYGFCIFFLVAKVSL